VLHEDRSSGPFAKKEAESAISLPYFQPIIAIIKTTSVVWSHLFVSDGRGQLAGVSYGLAGDGGRGRNTQ